MLAIAGVHPPLPKRLGRLLTDRERIVRLPNDIGAIQDAIASAALISSTNAGQSGDRA